MKYSGYPPYSILMSVYYKENPEYLRQSISSMLNQTVLPEQFVIVIDGPAEDGLKSVLKGFADENGDIFTFVWLPKNIGPGAAQQIGLEHCRNEWIAKMDSDDIAKTERCEKQLQAIMQFPQMDIVGAWEEEFIGAPENIQCLRKVPLSQKDIYSFARRRSPFNNPTVFYRKEAVIAAGGYKKHFRCEDYELYTRMMMNGAKCMNLPEVLLSFRISGETYAKRGNWLNTKSFIHVRYMLYKNFFISLSDLFVTCGGQVIIYFLPNLFRNLFYKKFLRK